MRFLKAVERAPTHKTLEVCSRKWERFDAELAAACFRFASGEVLRRLKMYRDTLQRRGLDVFGRAALWFVLQKYIVETGALQQVGLSRLIGLTFSGDLGLFLDSLDKILTELVEPASEDLVLTIVVPQLREASKTKTYHSLAVDIDIFDRAATGAAERSIEFFYRCARQCLARIDRETMRTSLTKVSAVAPVRPGGTAVTKMPCYAWIRGDCKLGDKCRFEHDPEIAPKSCGADETGKHSKGKGKNGKVVQPGGRHVQKCFRYLKGKCEKSKDCGFTHSKDDPSNGDLEVQRMAEKKVRESSGRDAATGVVLGGERLKVLIAPVEESENAETEDWIWDTGAALDVASAAVAGKREVSFAPPILSAGGVVNSVESVVVEMAETGDTVKAAVLPNTPNALSAGRRCAQQGFSFVWRPWEAKSEIWAPDGTPIECTTHEHFVPIVRRTKKPLKAAPVVESDVAGSADTRPVGDHEGVAGSGVVVDDPVSSIGYIREAGDSADCREMLKDIDRVVHDDDDAGSAEAHDRVAGSARFAQSLKTRNIAHPTPDLSRLNIKPCISREFVAVLDVTMERRCTSTSDGAREQPLG